MKFTAAFLVAAHTAAKANTASLPYRQRLSIAMKAAYAAAKAPATVRYEVTAMRKGFLNACTSSQAERLNAANLGLTEEQVAIFVSAREAKEIIALLDTKQQVTIFLLNHVPTNAIANATWGTLQLTY